MKKTHLLVSSLLVLGTIATLNFNVNNDVSEINNFKSNDEITLAAAPVEDKLASAIIYLDDLEDNAFLNVSGEILATNVDTLTETKLVIKQGAEVHEFKTTLNGANFKVRVPLKDLLSKAYNLYEINLVDGANNLITNLGNKNIAKGTKYFFNKASKQFFRLIDKEGLKIQMLDGVITGFEFKKDTSGAMNLVVNGLGNEKAKADIQLKADKSGEIVKAPFVRDATNDKLTATLNLSTLPTNKTIFIDVLNAKGMIGKTIKFKDFKNPENAAPYLELKEQEHAIDANDNIYRITGKKGDCYQLFISNADDKKMTGVHFNPLEDGRMYVSGVVNNTIKNGNYEIALTGNDVVIEKAKIVADENGLFEHTFSDVLMTRAVTKGELISVRLVDAKGNVDTKCGIYDEYLDWGWYGQRYDVLTKNFAPGRTNKYHVGFYLKEIKFDMAKTFSNVELENEVGFKFKIGRTEILEKAYEIITISDAAIFLDYDVPSYLKGLETGILFTKNAEFKDQTFVDVPSDLILSTYKEETAKVKGMWTVKLNKLETTNNLHTNFKFAPYYKEGNTYHVGKLKAASFYGLLSRQYVEETSTINKRAIALAMEQYK